MTYKTYMPKTHQLFCRICKKQNKMGESIIDVFGEVHLECYNKKVIYEFLEKVEHKWTMSKDYKSTANFGMLYEEVGMLYEELEGNQ